MAKVLNFPVKKQIPEEMKKKLYEVAKAYVKVMDEACACLCGDDPSNEDLSEIMGEVLIAYLGAVERAIEESEGL